MARADRLERMDNLRLDLEGEYRVALMDALAATAAGARGLLDPNAEKPAQAKAAPTIAALAERADEIDDLRDKLGLEPFALHRAFLARRKAAKAHDVGEPKQAQAWLEQLKAEA